MYKYEVCGADGVWRQKADPLAMQTQTPPERASIVFESEYEWGDKSWIRRAAGAADREPGQHLRGAPGVVAGRAHVRSSLPTSWSTTSSSSDSPTSSCCPSWSIRSAGPGAIRCRRTSRRPLASRPTGCGCSSTACTRPGVGVILDWVPAHFPKVDWALARFDGTALYEHADPARREHPQWGTASSTSAATRCATSSSPTRCFWLEEYHVDGLRVTPSPRCCILDYSREDDQWTPNIYGGRENLEAVLVSCKRSTRRPTSGCRASSPSPRSRPRGPASRVRRTSGASASGSSGTWAGCTTRWPTCRATRSIGSITTTR